MLKKLRNKKTARKIWIFLAVIIVPAFVLWGSGSMTRNKEENNIAGKIFGRPVSALEYKDALDAVRNLAVMQLGDKYSEMQKYLNLESQAWERLLLLNEAKRKRIRVSDKEVVDTIGSYPFFQNKSGFDERVYNEVLRYVFRTQPRIFEEQTRQNLMISKLFSAVTAEVTVSDKEVEEEYRKANEEISLSYVSSTPADFAKDVTTSDTEIKDYFTKNSLEFRQPLSFNVEYISLPEEGKSEIAVKNEIKNILGRLKRNESPVKVAKESGLIAKETGLFAETDPIPGIGWLPQMTLLISKAKANEYLPPVYADKAYYILKLKDRKEPYIPEFDKIKDKVKEALIKEKSQSLARAKIEECLKKLTADFQVNPKAVDFDSAAKACGLKSGATALFKFGSYIEGIGASDIFWTSAQGLKEEEPGPVITMPAAFYVIKIKSKVPVDEKKFAAEKPEFNKKILQQKKQEYFTRFATELKEKAQRF